MSRRGTKRKESEPQLASQDVSEPGSSASERSIVNDELTSNITPVLPEIEAWEPTSTAAAIAATHEPYVDTSGEHAIHNPLSHVDLPYQSQGSESQDYQYHEFHDWLNRWHIYQQSLINYWREYNQDTFNRKIHELADYRERHGDCNVPSTYVEEEPLGKWVERMRVEVKEGRLDVAKVEQLRSLGFNFSGGNNDDN